MSNEVKQLIQLTSDDYFDEDGNLMPEILLDDIINTYDIVYVSQIGFYMFDKIWVKVDGEYIKKLIKDKLEDRARIRHINEIYEQLKIETYINVSKLNLNKNRLVLQNGTIDLSDWGKPIFYCNQFFKEDYCTIQLKCNYNKDARPKEFLKFLSSTFEDDIERIKLIQEIIGYCLTTSTRFHKAFIFYGEGSNGKSVLLSAIENLVTIKNSTSVAMSDLNKPFSRSALLNKLINISSEQESSVKDTGYFKKIVSGDIVDAQFKGENQFEFEPYCKMLFAMNKLPQTNDRTEGYYRRFIIVPFNKIFKKHEQDKMLNEKLKDELDGILTFALEGLKRLAEQNEFTSPLECEKIFAQYKEDSNPLIQFFNENLIVTENGKVSKQELYDIYKLYCQNNGFKGVLNQINFGKELKRIFPDIKEGKMGIGDKRVNCYVGIELS